MKKNIVITVSRESLEDIEALRSKLTERGVVINNILSFGVITGEVEEQVIGEISLMNEVEHVDLDREIRLPPPESDIQ